MKITLTSSIVAYEGYTIINAAEGQCPRNVAMLTITMPPASLEAANVAGTTVKIGPANLSVSPTDVTSPEGVLSPDTSMTFGPHDKNIISLINKYFKGSANNVVLYISYDVR